MLDLDLCRHPLEFPRNLWSRLRLALHLIENRDFRQAHRVIEGVRYHPDMTHDLFAVFEHRLATAQSEAGAVQRINIPSDYLGSSDPRLLKPFRRLNPYASFPGPCNWAMPLPDLIGTGNDARFILEAAASLAGTFVPARRRIRVCYSPVGTSRREIEETLGTLARITHDGRLDISLFGAAEGPAPLALPGGGRIESHPFRLLDGEGLQRLRATLEECDLVLFLSGAARFDSLALVRALHVAEVSDNVVQPLIKHAPTEGFSTLFTQGAAREVFANRYPFRSVQGLNILITPTLLRETGLPDGRFESTYQAGRELSYRAFTRGAYFLPLNLPGLEGFDDRRRDSPDETLLLHLAPNHWDRKRDGRFEVPKVSVYIPAYNASKYIERAVDSVLEQDVADLDVCIANDGSRDGTLDLLQRRYGDNPQVRILDNPNGGIGFASNNAIRMSRSQYIGQLDSDDCLKPGAVRRLMSYLDEHPTVVCAYGSCERIDAEGRYLKDEYNWPVFSREKMLVTSIVHHFRMFRRYAWERTTRFREDIVNGVDYDIFLKMAETGEFHHVNEVLYQRRWHGENTSSVNEGHQTTNTYRVQRESLKRLGLDRHWDIHVPNPSQPRLVTHRLKPGTRMVVFWPDYSRANPYQKLLYNDLRQQAEVVAGTIEAALKLIADKVVGARDLTFHLHWLNALFRDCQTREAAQGRVDEFVARIEKFIWKGGRFVWTIHNAMSHDAAFADLEIALSRKLATIAHALHFHSAASIDEVDAVFPVPRAKVVVARHGHYLGVYPAFVTREAAREALGIMPDEDVIVFTGQIRGYKGIDTLIEAFRGILAARPHARLILAGAAEADPVSGHDLSEAERARILFVGRFIEEGELQLFFQAADVAVYPYEKILTSGSLLLALSYGVPCMIPRVGMTTDVLEGRSADMLYDGQGGVPALRRGIDALLDAKEGGRLDAIAQRARAIAAEMTWPAVGKINQGPPEAGISAPQELVQAASRLFRAADGGLHK